MRMIIILLVVLQFTLRAADEASQAPPWGANLFPDGSFEETTGNEAPADWKLKEHGRKGMLSFVTAEKGCAGKRCLVLQCAANAGDTEDRPAYADAVSPLIPAGEGWYLVSFWSRWEGPLPEPPSLVAYFDRFGDTGKSVGPDDQENYLFFRISHEWQYTFGVFRQRAENNAVSLRLSLQVYPAIKTEYRLLVDRIEIRPLQIPRIKDPISSTVIAAGDRLCQGGELVDDPATIHGRAWKVYPGKYAAGAKLVGPPRRSETPGLYEVVFRFRQEDRGDNDGTQSRNGLMLEAAGDGGRTWMDIHPADFIENKYQKFSLYFIYPFGRGSGYVWYWRGSGTYYFDQAEVRLLCGLSEREGWELLYKGIDLAKLSPDR